MQNDESFIMSNGTFGIANKDTMSNKAALPILLLNTTIATAYPAVFALSAPLTAMEAREFVRGREMVSAIGHQSTADAFGSVLGCYVMVNRVAAEQAPGQQALVLKLRGRLPEGQVLTLPELEAIGFDLLVMTRVDPGPVVPDGMTFVSPEGEVKSRCLNDEQAITEIDRLLTAAGVPHAPPEVRVAALLSGRRIL